MYYIPYYYALTLNNVLFFFLSVNLKYLLLFSQWQNFVSLAEEQTCKVLKSMLVTFNYCAAADVTALPLSANMHWSQWKLAVPYMMSFQATLYFLTSVVLVDTLCIQIPLDTFKIWGSLNEQCCSLVRTWVVLWTNRMVSCNYLLLVLASCLLMSCVVLPALQNPA